MRKLRTWKQFQASYSSSSKRGSFDAFFRDELPESRRIIRNVISETPTIDFGAYRSHIHKIIMQKNVERSNTSA